MEFFGDDENAAGSSEDGMAPNLLGSFIQELEETVADLEQKIVALEAEPKNSTLVNTVFRAFHNIKGSSTMVGLKILPELMHFAESVFDHVRAGRLQISEGIISLLFDVFGAMRELREVLKKEGKEGKKRYFSLLAKLEETAAAAEGQKAESLQDEEVQAKPERENREDDEFIKIGRSLVEQLMLVVGDFMLVESSFQFMKSRYSSDWTFIENCQQLTHFSSKLQNTVLRMRLSPIKSVFSAMHRVVRSTSQEVGKKVTLEVNGADTLVDRTILDVIADPIMHMMRNAIDHGIESPEARAAAGKAAEGHVTLAAFHKAGEVIVQISDDGKGMDPRRIRDKAVSKGFISAEDAAQLSDGECQQLIFLPGFSGAETVTNVSGRGVGMDVVKQVVESLKGNIELTSNPGSGTTITIRLPLSMAISECLEFQLGDRSYALPQICIEEVFSTHSPLIKDNIRIINDGSKVLLLRDTPMPLLDLANLFEVPSHDDKFHIIQVKHGITRFAFLVGAIVGPCNIVCQPLPAIFASDAPFSGMTRRGDGSLMFQVDVGRLANRVHMQNDGRSKTGAKIGGGTTITSSDLRRLQQKIAVFSNYEMFCVPVQDIKQVISADAHEIHDVDGKAFLTLNGSTVPLVWIEETLLKKPRIQRENYSVLIFHVEDRTYGLPMDKFGGIIRMPVQYDNALRSDIITGSTVIDNDTCLVIDLFGLTAHAFGRDISMPETRTVASIKRLAIAEDDPFFRQQLLTFLKARDFECTAFPDGLALKEFLQVPENAKKVDAVLTDIEMPRMDGLTLTRWIKGTDFCRHLPCLVITALTNREVIRLAVSAGASSFIPKMHHQQVLQELKRIESGLEKQENEQARRANEQETSSRRVVTFSLGVDRFAMPMEVLKEVSHISPSVQVPNFPVWMQSITAFRGKMIPVLDLGKLLGLTSPEHSNHQQAIVDTNGFAFALRFDSIEEVLLYTELTSGEGLGKATGAEAHMSQFIKGVYQKDGQIISLLDPVALAKVTSQKMQVNTREEIAA